MKDEQRSANSFTGDLLFIAGLIFMFATLDNPLTVLGIFLFVQFKRF